MFTERIALLLGYWLYNLCYLGCAKVKVGLEQGSQAKILSQAALVIINVLWAALLLGKGSQGPHML